MMALLSVVEFFICAAIRAAAHYSEGGRPAVAAAVPGLIVEYSLQYIGTLVAHSLFVVRESSGIDSCSK